MRFLFTHSWILGAGKFLPTINMVLCELKEVYFVTSLHASLVLVPNEFFFLVQEKKTIKKEYTANSLFIKGLPSNV